MKTLIELYDERPIENVLASEVFCPAQTIFLCPPEIASSKQAQETLRRYMRHRRLSTGLSFAACDLNDSGEVARRLREIVAQYPGCVIDVTGGTDAALFAGGMVCAELHLPAFTYSRRNNCFFNIHNAPFADRLPCTVQHKVEDCFLMTGGALRIGRVNRKEIGKYLDDFPSLFALYFRHRGEWPRAVRYFQMASRTTENAQADLTVTTPYTVKGERNSVIEAPFSILRELETLGMIVRLQIGDGRICFTFRDALTRTWLRDVGSVLELYIYRECVKCDCFNDVEISALVNWENDASGNAVTNEIDVMAMRGILPVFISCKTGAVSTQALNELAVLRDRFGGKGAVAAIVTAQSCRSITRRRAWELGIHILEADDLRDGNVGHRIRDMLRLS